MEQDKNNRLTELFNQARNEPSKVSFEETKNQFLSNVKNGNFSMQQQLIRKLFNFKAILIMTLSITTLTVATLYFINSYQVPLEKSKPELAINPKSDSVLITEEHEKVVATYLAKINPVKAHLIPKKIEGIKPLAIKRISKLEIVNHGKNVITKDTAYRFPVLTAEEIKETTKQKYQMLRELARYNRMPAMNNIDDRKYPRVYWNPVVKIGKVSSINGTGAFHIQKTEVSNLEYRTYLFDLLIQNRKDEFMMVKPDQLKWDIIRSPYNKLMRYNYFSDRKYDNYPVVNISRKGAELYCKWLADEINKSQQKRLNGLTAIVRIPMVDEWMYAASGGKNFSYGWNLDIRQNSRGCFLANFKYSPTIDTISFIGCNPKYLKARTTSGILLGMNSYTVQVSSYNPNNFGLYCISGNAAEMVSYPDGKIGAKGGSWNSTGENIKITAPDEFKGVRTPNVNIGFRPVITFIKNSDKE